MLFKATFHHLPWDSDYSYFTFNTCNRVSHERYFRGGTWKLYTRATLDCMDLLNPSLKPSTFVKVPDFQRLLSYFWLWAVKDHIHLYPKTSPLNRSYYFYDKLWKAKVSILVKKEKRNSSLTSTGHLSCYEYQSNYRNLFSSSSKIAKSSSTL